MSATRRVTSGETRRNAYPGERPSSQNNRLRRGDKARRSDIEGEGAPPGDGAAPSELIEELEAEVLQKRAETASVGSAAQKWSMLLQDMRSALEEANDRIESYEAEFGTLETRRADLEAYYREKYEAFGTAAEDVAPIYAEALDKYAHRLAVLDTALEKADRELRSAESANGQAQLESTHAEQELTKAQEVTTEIRQTIHSLGDVKIALDETANEATNDVPYVYLRLKEMEELLYSVPPPAPWDYSNRINDALTKLYLASKDAITKKVALSVAQNDRNRAYAERAAFQNKKQQFLLDRMKEKYSAAGGKYI